MRFVFPLTLLVAGIVSGCTVFGGGENAKLRASPTFQMGYSDGCAAANQEGSNFRDRTVQDPTLYKSDEAYHAGWSDGYASCRTTNAPPGAQPGSNPLGGPLPGTH